MLCSRSRSLYATIAALTRARRARHVCCYVLSCCRVPYGAPSNCLQISQLLYIGCAHAELFPQHLQHGPMYQAVYLPLLGDTNSMKATAS